MFKWRIFSILWFFFGILWNWLKLIEYSSTKGSCLYYKVYLPLRLSEFRFASETDRFIFFLKSSIEMARNGITRFKRTFTYGDSVTLADCLVLAYHRKKKIILRILNSRWNQHTTIRQKNVYGGSKENSSTRNLLVPKKQHIFHGTHRDAQAKSVAHRLGPSMRRKEKGRLAGTCQGSGDFVKTILHPQQPRLGG